jgi:uncharacterized protein YjbJ (UPF0337 family)
MNWDRIAGTWRQLKGIARKQWGRLTADYASVVAGERERLCGKIQATHGIARQASEKQLAEWMARQHKIDPIHK